MAARRGRTTFAIADKTTAPAVAPRDRKTVGLYVGLCILVQFPDVPGSISQAEVDEFLNGVNYSNFANNGSVREYFHDVSGGRLTYHSVTTPYITTRFPRSYYVDREMEYLVRARELVVEVLTALQASGFDFSELTLADEQYIRAVNIFHAGPCVNNYREGLWPHADSLERPVEVAPGHRAYDYQISDLGNELTLGTYCHENGHMVCDFPDLYDTDLTEEGNPSAGAGNFCLMSTGGTPNPKNPTHVAAYLKYRAGWSDSLKPLVSGVSAELRRPGNHFYIYTKDIQEYFILEYRDQSARDAAIPGSGLAIWHVDEKGNNNNEQGTPNQHYECALMQADGLRDLETNRNTGEAQDLYPYGAQTEFSDTTVPDSRWWDGSASGLAIRDIRTTSTGVVFKT